MKTFTIIIAPTFIWLVLSMVSNVTFTAFDGAFFFSDDKKAFVICVGFIGIDYTQFWGCAYFERIVSFYFGDKKNNLKIS